jgi:diguanylate cyclase (GGDEF)-like protein
MAIANLQLRETLRNQSIRDPLTALFNRRYAEETLSRELSRAAREQLPLSLLLLDVDHFKKFNDAYGHETGDEVLKRIAALLRQKTRGGDVASRLGGEELLVLLPGAALGDALNRAEQIRLGVEALELRVSGKVIGPVTISTGVAVFPTHGTDAAELLRSADAALYKAKHLGRNRVVAAE